MTTKKWRFQSYDYDKKSNEYAHRTWCLNCRMAIYIYIKKGNRIKDVLPDVKCENCGVFQGEQK